MNLLNNFNSTYIYKIENYNNGCERIIKMPVSVFGLRGRKGTIKRDKNDRIDSDKLSSSISRSKRNIRRICLSNDFEYFATWTVSSEFADRFSVQDVENRVRYLLKEYQRVNKDFKYIYVFERHKNGAIHLHGMVKGLSDLREYNENDFKSLPYYILDTLDKRS